MSFLNVVLRGVVMLPSAIQATEALFGTKSGAQKKEAALSLVSTAINVADAVEQKMVVDGPGFSAGMGQVIDGVVACLNASLWHK